MSSIRESYDICSDLGGIQFTLNCVSSPIAIFDRAGSASDGDYRLTINPAIASGSSYTFPIPPAVLSMPVGYYDLTIMDGGLVKKTVRLNLHTSSLSSFSKPVATECERDMPEPNTEIVTVCEPCPDSCQQYVCEREIRQAKEYYDAPKCCVPTMLFTGHMDPAQPCITAPTYSNFIPVDKALENAKRLAERRFQYKINDKLGGGITEYILDSGICEYSNVADYYDKLFKDGVLNVTG